MYFVGKVHSTHMSYTMHTTNREEKKTEKRLTTFEEFSQRICHRSFNAKIVFGWIGLSVIGNVLHHSSIPLITFRVFLDFFFILSTIVSLTHCRWLPLISIFTMKLYTTMFSYHCLLHRSKINMLSTHMLLTMNMYKTYTVYVMGRTVLAVR